MQQTNVHPTLMEREEGLGWMASTPPGFPLRFAVVALSVDAAVEKFQVALTRWSSMGSESDTDTIEL